MKRFLLIVFFILFSFSIFTGCDKFTDKKSGNSVIAEKKFSTDELVEAVKSTGEWPNMVKVEDNEMAKEFFKLDLKDKDYVEISIFQCPMSAALAEIIIINPADSKLEEAKIDLKARKEKLIKTDAFYPDHKNIAEKSIIGDVGGYAYMIVGSAANEGEKALIEKVKG